MDPEVSERLLAQHWDRARAVVAANGQDPDRDLWRDGLNVFARLEARSNDDGSRDPYVFSLKYVDYDEHGPTIGMCDPNPPHRAGVGFEFYAKLEGNNTFDREAFFCMPGDRRACDVGGHHDWRNPRHYHPEAVLASLIGLLNSPAYRGRRP